VFADFVRRGVAIVVTEGTSETRWLDVRRKAHSRRAKSTLIVGDQIEDGFRGWDSAASPADTFQNRGKRFEG
jgi:hypothetical protein